MTVIIPEPESSDTVVDAVADTATAVAHAVADAVATGVEVIEQREAVGDLVDAAEMTRLRQENERLNAELAYERGRRDAEVSNEEVLETAIIAAAIVAEEVAEEIVTVADTPTDTAETEVTEVEDKTPDVKVETQEDYDNKEDKRRRKMPYGRARK